MQLPTLTNPQALTGLLLIIPIILLYLLKPKPKHIKFPTIMFFTRMEKDKRFKLFPKRFIRDPLLLIQILIISFMILAIANPFLTTQTEKRPDGNIALILDASASMQATDIQPNRFKKSVEYAKKIITESTPESRFTIILAENIPLIALRDGDTQTAHATIDKLVCADTPTNIGDSILFAKDILSTKEKNKEIYVFSDYSASEGFDIALASKIASIEKINTKFVAVTNEGKNIAITDIDAKRFLTNRNRFYLIASIENFNYEDSKITGEILLDGETLTEISETIPAKSTKLINIEDTLSTDSHILTVKINTQDDLKIDDTAYVAIPSIKKYSVLLITDENSDTYLEYALRSSADIKLTKAISPIIPEFNGFDTIIHGEIPEELLLEGMYIELTKYMEEGGNLIILASTDLGDIEEPELKDLMPVTLGWIKNTHTKINIEKEHEILKDTLLENIIVKKYFKAETKENTEIIATVSGMPEIAYHRYGKGKVVYVGVNPNPTWSNFYYSSSMPIFWFQLTKWINKAETATNQHNFQTGEHLPLKNPVNLTTPSNKRFTVENILFDEVGIYTTEYLGNLGQIAVNLVNEKESNIRESLNIETINPNQEIKKEKIDIIWDLYPYMLGAVTLLLILELIYYLKRGYFQA